LTSSTDIPEIVVSRDQTEIVRRLVDRSPLRLGRDGDNDLILNDPSVLGKHAEVAQESGRWWIRCLDDRQTLEVSGRTYQACALKDGDQIGIGPFELRFREGSQALLDSGGELDPGRTRVFDASNTMVVPDIEPSAQRVEIPGYEISKEVGRGGMGRVYQAIQISTRRTVALKIMLEGPFTSEKSKRRFEREVHIVASLRHPNIAQIYESGLHEGRYWFAMEFVDGEPLDAPDMVAGLTTKDRLALMATVCEAVGHAHDKMIVHRDLKPTNIIISKDGEPHVLDFGLAKVEDPQRDQDMMLSMAGELMGTPAYMSPEQTERDPGKVDARTDVYSLGVILYQLLTGQFPYNVRGRLDEVIHEIATTDPTRPSQISREVDSEAEAIVLKAIAKDPGERYATGKEMGQDLRRLLAGEPVYAKLASRSYVLTKTVSRNRWPLIGAGVLASAVVASVLVTRAWFAPRPERPQPAAEPATTGPAMAGIARPTDPPSRVGVLRSPDAATSAPATRTAQPALTRKPTTTPSPASQAPAPEAPTAATSQKKDTSPEGIRQGADAWLARLSSYMEKGDYLRARLALERLRSRFADTAAVARSADELKRHGARIETKLGKDTVRLDGQFLLHSRPSNTADWQAATAIAQEIVATRSTVGIVLVRVLLEDETITSEFEVRGKGVGLYGGQEVTTQRRARSGDILFVGADGGGNETPGITIVAERHCAPTIDVKPERGQVDRLGDVVIRKRDD